MIFSSKLPKCVSSYGNRTGRSVHFTPRSFALKGEEPRNQPLNLLHVGWRV